MGIVQSVMRSLGIEADGEEEKAISKSDYVHQWRKGNPQTGTHEGRYLSVTVGEVRGSSSLANTIVTGIVKDNCPNVTKGRRRRRRRREEFPVTMKCTAAAEVEAEAEVRWITHYSSRHRILLVGEGDFSFSTCLASAFGSASNMVATSLDSLDFLVNNYRTALSNLVELSIRKCKVMHEINATEMANHADLGSMKFDRIIFNFPFAGFFKDMPRDVQLRQHRILVSGFMENAKQMLSENGEIHITHKTNGFHKEWMLGGIACLNGLKCVEAVEFNNEDYYGYNTKYGFGSDNNFNCNPSRTFKFKLIS